MGQRFGSGCFAGFFTGCKRRTEDMGSPYVPLDSWVYPAFDRLIARGRIQTAYVGLRPWTRLECARLLQEAEEQSGNSSAKRQYGEN